MNKRLILLCFICLTYIVGCSTSSLTVNSVPEKAKVFIRPVGGGELVSMGETPLVLSSDQMKASGAESGPIIVEIQKTDFKKQRVLVTESDSVDMKIDFALELEDGDTGLKGPGNTLADAQSLNMAVDRLFEVRKFIKLESYGEALKHLRYIENKWPFLAATYEMKGGILFLQKKYRDALSAYAISLKYNPKSVPAAEMTKTLEDKLGIDGSELAKQYVKKNRALASLEKSSSKSKKKKKKKRKSKRRKKKKKKSQGGK